MTDHNPVTFTAPTGYLDGVIDGYIAGWAWNPVTPEQPVSVDIWIDDKLYLTVNANQFRQDLLTAGVGNGSHSFLCPLKLNNPNQKHQISVRLAGTSSELINSPMGITNLVKPEPKWDLISLKIDPYNIEFSLKKLKSARIKHLLIDINDTCNADCVYCPNLRSQKRIELAEFEELLTNKLAFVETFQFGCGQEPTADKRLPQFYQALHQAELKPQRTTMISNATLLHRHDLQLFQACGLVDLQVSLDTVDTDINAITRRGTEVAQIRKNLQYIREKCPDLGLIFSAVINSLTLGGVEKLLNFGESLGVTHYYLREIFDHTPASFTARNQDYQEWMSKLTLQPGEFQQMRERLSHHPTFDKITFIPAENLSAVLQDMNQSNHNVRSA